VPPLVSTLRLAALMIFIALVAVAVWLADLRLAIALPLVGLAWVIAALIEWLAWRSARSQLGYAEGPLLPPPEAAFVPVAPVPAAEPEAPAAHEPGAPVEPSFAPPPLEPEPEAEAETDVRPPAEPEHETVEPEPQPEPEPAPVAEAEARPPVAAVAPPRAPAPAPGPERPERRRGRRMRLRPVPPPPVEQAPAPAPAPQREPGEAEVVDLPQRVYQPRSWNLWDLERLARTEGRAHPERRDEWAFLFVHLRQFANADGELPREFDSLVRDSFAGLLERQPGR
jgi:hypothetical protein